MGIREWAIKALGGCLQSELIAERSKLAVALARPSIERITEASISKIIATYEIPDNGNPQAMAELKEKTSIELAETMGRKMYENSDMEITEEAIPQGVKFTASARIAKIRKGRTL